MKIILLAACAAVAFATTTQSPAVQEVDHVLNDWHDAAAKADFTRYFSHFTDEAVFLGSDATERWTTPQFRIYAKPYFDKGKAWTLIPKERHVFISAEGNTAWFDEKVVSPAYGLCRGTGVLVKSHGIWKIAQYNYTLPIPNEIFLQVVDMIEHPKTATPSIQQTGVPAAK